RVRPHRCRRHRPGPFPGRGGRRRLAAGVPRRRAVDRVRPSPGGRLLPGPAPEPPAGRPAQPVGDRPVHLRRSRRARLDPRDGAVDGPRPGGGHRRRARVPRRGRWRGGSSLPRRAGGLPGVTRVNLASIIEGHPDDAVAIVSRGKPTSYGALREQVGALRGGLAGLGIERGDRVAIVYANNRFFVVTYLATLGLGAVAVPLNPASPSAELERQLADVGASVVGVGPRGRDG